MLNVKDIKRDFPVLENRDVIYLDNAATTLTPEPVIESLNHYYRELGASVHRGIYQLADETTKEYEHSREKVAEFIGANSSREVVFTKNCTEGLNIIAYSLHLWPEKKGKILVTEMDHHSNILPWRFMARGSEKFELEYVDVTGEGKLDMEDFRDKLSGDKTKDITDKFPKGYRSESKIIIALLLIRQSMPKLILFPRCWFSLL